MNKLLMLLTVFICFSASAQTITYSYDNLGRITKVQYSDSSSMTYAYDAAGNRTALRTLNPCINATKPSITPSGLFSFCQGDSVKLTSSKSIHYVWSNGDTSQTITINKSGNYYVQAIDNIGCLKNSDTISVTVNSLPVANAGIDTTLWFGSSTIIGAHPAASGNAPFKYNWEPVTKLNSPIIGNPVASPDTTTKYALAVTDVNGCKGVDSVVVKVVPCDSLNSPIPTISSIGDSILISTTANYYQWYFNNNEISTAKSKSVHVDKVGFYKVETSPNNVCWLSSLDYPVVVTQNPLRDTLKMVLYPNPSTTGSFNVYVKLPQPTGVETYVTVYDVSGKQIVQTQKLIFFGDEIRIPVTLNTKGSFVVKVFVNGDSQHQTIIIQ